MLDENPPDLGGGLEKFKILFFFTYATLLFFVCFVER